MIKFEKIETFRILNENAVNFLYNDKSNVDRVGYRFIKKLTVEFDLLKFVEKGAIDHVLHIFALI